MFGPLGHPEERSSFCFVCLDTMYKLGGTGME